ncbi:outer membrane lipoprotein-sorting protein [Tuwongella immobilis]|uniref:outer membrane lipoprotein-sorting protein n=1 Tax=Tuwongella immobilis TaxID=692036 RepID=UPI0013A692F5|nr:outer membrane lipoprotein-sorting protein [Tuwongella immobilis]
MFIFLSLFSLAPASESFEQIRSNHQNAVSGIVTLQCKINIEYSPAQQNIFNEEALVISDTASNRTLIKHRIGTTSNTILVRDNLIRRLTSDSKRAIETEGLISNSDMPIDCDPWAYSLITLYGPTRFRSPLNDIFSHKDTSINSVRDDLINGHRVKIVELEHTRARLTISFDTSNDYLIRQVRLVDQSVDATSTVLEFTQSNNRYFPKRVEISNSKNNSTCKVTFSDIKINQPLKSQSFEFRFPPGILVTDLVRNDLFRTNNSGEPTLVAKNKQGQRLTLSQSEPVESDQSMLNSTKFASTSEAFDLTAPIIFIFSFLVLILGMVLFAVQRSKKAKS